MSTSDDQLAHSSSPATDPAVTLAVHVRAALFAEAPDSFAGLVFDERGATAVYATGDGAAAGSIVERICGRPPSSADSPIIVLMAREKPPMLESVRDVISERLDELEQLEVRVQEWDVDLRANRTRVGVENLTPEGGMLVQRGKEWDHVREPQRPVLVRSCVAREVAAAARDATCLKTDGAPHCVRSGGRKSGPAPTTRPYRLPAPTLVPEAAEVERTLQLHHVSLVGREAVEAHEVQLALQVLALGAREVAGEPLPAKLRPPVCRPVVRVRRKDRDLTVLCGGSYRVTHRRPPDCELVRVVY